MTADQQNIEIYDNEIMAQLNIFCEENGIKDMKKESQAVWNSALYFIYKNVFKGGVLKSTVNYNITDTSLSYLIHKSYIYISNTCIHLS